MTESFLWYSLLTCLTERNCLWKTVLQNLFLGFINLKHCSITFCDNCAFFCMIFLKTVRFYKSKIVFFFIFVEEIFAEKVVNLKKICSTKLKKDIYFAKNSNCKNAFHKATYLGYWIAEINSAKISFANDFFALGNNFPYLLSLVLLAVYPFYNKNMTKYEV